MQEKWVCPGLSGRQAGGVGRPDMSSVHCSAAANHASASIELLLLKGESYVIVVSQIVKGSKL